MSEIKKWMLRNLPADPVILEVGAHRGEDTLDWLEMFDRPVVHCWEPDEFNYAVLATVIPAGRVWLHREALGDREEQVLFYPSVEWTESGSVRPPTGHLEKYPEIRFGEPRYVKMRTLDSYEMLRGLEVDLLWVDAQGNEEDVFKGGKKVLSRSKYVYTEYSEVELYRGQGLLADILHELKGFKVVQKWTEDILLRNTLL